jgi:hypothetical protein
MRSRTYTCLPILPTLPNVDVERVSSVQALKVVPAHPAHPEKAMQKPGNLRAEMPTVAGWIDDLRAAFGAETINAAIRAGMNGQPTFYAEENGRAVGTKSKGEGQPLAEAELSLQARNAQRARAWIAARGGRK